MPSNVASELERFHVFVAGKIANGGTRLSPEEVLDEWRAENPTAEELAASVADLEQALGEADRGEGIPLDQVIEELRQKHGFSKRAFHE